MESKFKLTNVVLYAKGWYLESDDIWEDLKNVLKLDDYTPLTKGDVYNILLNATQESKIYRWTELREVMNGIHPSNCWKFGYYVKENHGWSNKDINDLPDYNVETAFIYYLMSNLRFLDSEHWNPKMPKVTKYPKGKDITIRRLYEHFAKKDLVD
jgi:hypothetical protein